MIGKNEFSEKIISWFEKNKRNLPWRNTQNPYFIWLSEIILQQTRVEQGLPYYLNFAKKFPSVEKIAKASEDEILKLWQGLGYYTRARNLHYTAKIICEKYDGKFPNNYSEILQLKGVGKYTAAAIASFAFNLPYPVVDGNVQRVLARIFGIDEPVEKAKFLFYALAEKLIDKKNPALFNQAIMEYGAIHCTPANPKCRECIFKKKCIAYKTGKISELPVKSKKIKLKNRYFNYLQIQNGEKIYLQKRIKNDIWKNLYEFPHIESKKLLSKKEIISSSEWKIIFNGIKYQLISASENYKHILSHQKIHTRFWRIKISGRKKIPFLEIRKSELKNYAVPRLIELYLEKSKMY